MHKENDKLIVTQALEKSRLKEHNNRYAKQMSLIQH